MDDLNFVDKSDFMFHRVSGKVTLKDDYYEIINESNLDFIWGNYYAFLNSAAITKHCRIEDKSHSSSLEQQSLDKNGFFAFSYNTDAKDLALISEYQAKGFSLDIALGMVRTEPMLTISNENLTLGIVNTDEEWQAVINNQLNTSCLAKEESVFLEKRFVDYQEMIEAGLGVWFYAKKDGRIVGNLGLFFDEGCARFQQVETLAEARNQGVCQSLVSYAGNYCLNKLRMKCLIIVAEEGSIASHIYQKLGFETQLYTYSFLKLK